MVRTDPKSATSSEPTRLLIIAGRDSSGGAGVVADIEAAKWAGVSARVVVTAEIRQGSEGLVELGARPPREWVEEASRALEDGIEAVKFGLLPGAEHVEAAARLLGEIEERVPVVVDPVLAPSLGGRFLDDLGVLALREELLPRGCVLTPNILEAAELTERSLKLLMESPEARVEAAEELIERGAGGVLMKGGHAAGELAELVYEPGREPVWLRLERRSGALRGTGCRHATAVAASLAKGVGLSEAAEVSSAWIGSLFPSQGAF